MIDLENLSPEELQRLVEEHPELAEQLMQHMGFEEDDGEGEEGDYDEMDYDEAGEMEMEPGDEEDEGEHSDAQHGGEPINEEEYRKILDAEVNPELLKLSPLDPFRKVRREVLNAINKVRTEEGLQPLSMDYYITDAATQYAEYCASTERDGNPVKLQELLNACGAPGTYKAVTGYRYLEEEEQATAEAMLPKFFLDAYGLTFEINETREEIMRPEHTHVALGLALLKNLYVIAEVYSAKPLVLEAIKATEDAKFIEITGRMQNDQVGPYAVRVLDQGKPAALVGPDKMKYNKETKDFQVLLDKPDMLCAKPPMICEIYLRQKPQSIAYGEPLTSDVEKDLVHLKLEYKGPLEMYPDPRILIEETRDKAREELEESERQKREEIERQRKRDIIESMKRVWEQGIEYLKEEEKTREMEGNPYASYSSYEDSFTKSKVSVDALEDQKDGSIHKSEHSRRSSNPSFDDGRPDEPDAKAALPEESKQAPELTEHETRLLDAQEKQEREKLERSIMLAKEEYAKLKEENGKLQHKVATFLSSKSIQQPAGDAAVNMLKYINALVNVTQVRVQMKNTQESYNKMAQELQEKLQYHQQRSDEMKASFKDFKMAVAKDAVFSRSGKKMPVPELSRWESEEDRVDQELQKERFTYITNKRKQKQLEEELKKKDKLAEGLHVIDFEQLKIENQTLNEKIEERNENIHSLNTKIRKGVITYTHMREKLHQLKKKIDQWKKTAPQIAEESKDAGDAKTAAKQERIIQEARLERLRKVVGFLEVNKEGNSKIAGKLKKVGIERLVPFFREKI